MNTFRWKPMAAWIYGIACIGLCAPVAAADILDQAKVHYDYNNGDFDQVEQDLEAFKKRNKTYSHEDSVFIAKHLAVVYAANPQTREKGRYYMFRLLELLPSARIVDMFVSEEIDRIFEKVKEEFQEKQIAFGKVPSGKRPADPPLSGKTPPSKDPGKSGGSSGTVYWVAGGAGLVAIGVAAYFLVPRPETTDDIVYVVDKEKPSP
jgi:hypothetical protein